MNIRNLTAALLLVLAVICAFPSTPATAQPAAGRNWHTLAALPVAADGLAAITLNDGSVLAVGGDAAARGATRLAARFIPARGSWVRLPDAPVPLATPGMLELSAHQVLVVAPSFASGGTPTPSRALLLDPLRGTWTMLPPCPTPLLQPRLQQLSATEVFAAGGVGNQVGALLNVTTGKWTKVPSPVPNLATYAVASLPRGRVLLVAGIAVSANGSPMAVQRAFALNVSAHWQTLARPPVPADGEHAVVLDGGQVLLAGGYPIKDDPNAPVPPALLYDPTRNSWRVLPATGAASRGGLLVALPGGRAMLIGGHYPAGTPSAQCLLLENGQWRAVEPLPGPWSGYAVTALPGGNVLLIGGDRPVGDGFAASGDTLVLLLSPAQG